MSGGREKARGWGADAPLTTRVEPPMASSEWPDNVGRGPTSNEFVKRALSTVSPNETARRKLR